MKRFTIILTILCYSSIQGAQSLSFSNRFAASGQSYAQDCLRIDKAGLKCSAIFLGLWAVPHLVNMVRYGWKRYSTKRRINAEPTDENIRNYVQTSRPNNVDTVTYASLDQRQFAYRQDDEQKRSSGLEQLTNLVSGYDNDPHAREDEVQQAMPRYNALENKPLSWPFYLASFIPYGCSRLWYYTSFLASLSVIAEGSINQCLIGVPARCAIALIINKLQENFVPEFRIMPCSKNRRLDLFFEEYQINDTYRKLGENLLAATIYFGASFALNSLASKNFLNRFG